MRGSVRRERTSFASAPSSTSGASVRRNTPSSLLRRSPRSTFSSMRFHTGGGGSSGREGRRSRMRPATIHRAGAAQQRDARSGGPERASGTGCGGGLLLAPGQRHELAAVLGQLLRDGVGGVEHGHAAVDLDGG